MSGGKPAARLGDSVAHDGSAIIGHCVKTFIGGPPAAHMTHLVNHYDPPHPEAIVEGSGSVLIENLPAARMGDRVSCSGKISNGCGNVLIGD